MSARPQRDRKTAILDVQGMYPAGYQTSITVGELERHNGEDLLSLAPFAGPVRLIDNFHLTVDT